MPGTKNIIIIGPAYPLRGGGMATFNERMAKALQQKGHRVTIYTFSLQYPSFLFPGKTQLSTEAPPAELNIKVRINSVWPLNWVSVGNEIRRLQPDVVIVRYWLPFMGPCLGTILRIIRRNNKTKIVCIADNILPHEKRMGDLIFTKYFVKPVHRFIVMSQEVLDQLKEVAPHKQATLVKHPLYDNFGAPMPKSEARIRLGIDENRPVILFFGFIRKYKGLDLLLDAMPIVRNKIPNISLVVAGEFYDNEEKYHQQIKDLNIAESLLLRTGFVSDADVPVLFSAADVVVQPYRSATQSGVTPLAYHFELPMVVTNVGGLPEMVPDNKTGIVTEPNAQSIAEGIIRFFDKPRGHFSEGIISQKILFSWDKFCDALLSN